MTPSLFDETGRPLSLATRIGKGGEGEVYLISGAESVVKYYTLPDLRTREQKVREMLANGLATKFPLVAFPKSLVFDKTRKFAGFTMTKVSAHKPLHELYAPGARKVEFPQANFRFLVLAATNIARAIGSANVAGCVVGDINHSGILVSPKATVTLIDADSFQISATNGGILPCVVGVPEYTPPELQGKSLSAITRTENHDAFGLAIATFLLLFMGRHPFSGRYSGGDMPLEKAIAEFRFAYSTKRSVGMSPPPGVPTLKDLPSTIGEAFEAAFGPSGVTSRPTPRQWMALLDELKDGLKICPTNGLHHYSHVASDCPWCRMEKRFLVPLFLPYISDVDLQTEKGPLVGDVVAIWGAIQAVRPPLVRLFPAYTGITPEPSDEVKAIGKQRRIKNISGWAAAAAAVGMVVAAVPGTIFMALLLGALALYLIASKPSATTKLEEAFKTIQSRLYEAENDWDYSNTATEFHNLKALLKKKKEEYDTLPAGQKAAMEEYARNRRSIQLQQYLSKQLIRNYKIPKIGAGRKAVLLSYGIETAADVKDQVVLAVPGFGPKTAEPLITWRRQMVGNFIYNTAQTPADIAATNLIKANIVTKAAQLKAELGMGPAKLSQLAVAIPSKQVANASFIELLQQQRAQALANIEALGISPPKVDRPPPKQASHAPAAPVGTAPLQATPGSARCPKCGGNMVIRLATKGQHRGNKFYGCTRYPSCNGTRKFP